MELPLALLMDDKAAVNLGNQLVEQTVAGKVVRWDTATEFAKDID